MNTTGAYYILVLALSLAGVALIVLAVKRRAEISRSATLAFVETPMQVLSVNFVGKNLTGEAAAGPPSDATSMVLAKYAYSVNGRRYESRSVFPVEVEWMRPRISPLTLYEELKSGVRRVCYLDAANPECAYLFTGWTPYLRMHVYGLLGSAVAVLLGAGFFGVLVSKLGQ